MSLLIIIKFTIAIIQIVNLVANVNGATELTCSESTLRSTCTLVDLNADAKFNFTLASGPNKYNVYYLNIKSSTLSYLPNGLFQYLVNVNTVSIVNCGVRELSRSDFENAKRLRTLDLSYNGITKLDADVFTAAILLERINLTSNQIESIDANAFRNLTKLQRITLAYNRIRVLPANVFATVKLLSSVDLSYNLMETLNDDELFSNLNLSELRLGGNQLVAIETKTLANIKSVKQLDLSYNRIVNLSLNGLSNIENISLNNNRLTNLILNGQLKIIQADNNFISNANIFVTEGKVQNSNVIRLSMKNNSLTSIGFVRDQTLLSYLDVSFNPIVAAAIERDTFAKLAELKSLYMESIQLQAIDYAMFAPLAKLEILDISYNNLSTINFHSLSILHNLKQLFINGNNLASITLDEFEYLFPNFKSIDISDNNILCSDLVEILKKLKQLNIGIYVETDKSIADEPNIRGMRCSATNGTNLVNKQPTFVHPHDIFDGAELSSNQIAWRLHQLQKANDDTQFQVNQILNNLNFNNLDNYAVELSRIKLQLDELKTDNKLLNEKLEQANDKLKGITDMNGSTDGNAFRNQIDNLNKTLEAEIKAIMVGEEVHNDIKFVKVLFIVLLAAGIVFGIYKVAIAYIQRRSSYRAAPYNTMGVNMYENNF